jgi:hypothetical protein
MLPAKLLKIINCLSIALEICRRLVFNQRQIYEVTNYLIEMKGSRVQLFHMSS